MLYPSRERGKTREERASRGDAELAEGVFEGCGITRWLIICGKELLKVEAHRIANKTLK